MLAKRRMQVAAMVQLVVVGSNAEWTIGHQEMHKRDLSVPRGVDQNHVGTLRVTTHPLHAGQHQTQHFHLPTSLQVQDTGGSQKA